MKLGGRRYALTQAVRDDVSERWDDVNATSRRRVRFLFQVRSILLFLYLPGASRCRFPAAEVQCLVALRGCL
jgi:hypothetical protein